MIYIINQHDQKINNAGISFVEIRKDVKVNKTRYSIFFQIEYNIFEDFIDHICFILLFDQEIITMIYVFRYQSFDYIIKYIYDI